MKTQEISPSVIKVALLLNEDEKIRRWQYEALELALQSNIEVVSVLHCTNNRNVPRKPKYAAYYALALIGRRRMSMNQNMDVRSLIPASTKILHFESEWEGAWQRIPSSVAAQLNGADLVIKFGMNLLRDPENLPVRLGVLSYHHGDPEVHRGRPAGFYELNNGEHVMGAMVQKLSNVLDGGEVLAKGYSRVNPTSYSRTLNDAFIASVPLLDKAIKSLRSGQSETLTTLGPNHKLPTNQIVIHAIGKMGRARVARLIYGALKEKRWKVAFIPEALNPEKMDHQAVSAKSAIALPKGYIFAADPAGESEAGVFCELMNSRTGKGEIWKYKDGDWDPVDFPTTPGHMSYPHVVTKNGTNFLFPEMAQISSPRLFELSTLGDAEVISTHPLQGLEQERLIDGTLFFHQGYWYLFAGRNETADVHLHLWVAENLFGPWKEHPDSPICMDPRNARMAGPIIDTDGHLYRLGQDGSVGYGQGVQILRIEQLTPSSYKETLINPYRLKGVHGPHTVLESEGGYWIDFYRDKWSIFAGVRRLMALLNR